MYENACSACGTQEKRQKHAPAFAAWSLDGLMGAGVLAIIGTAPSFGQLSPQKPDLLGRDELPGFVYWNRYSDTQKRDCIKQGGISPEGLFDPMRYPVAEPEAGT
jgi:hypothetical protein